jgi:cobalt-zinc-cadmium efflux system outer membrane protein
MTSTAIAQRIPHPPRPSWPAARVILVLGLLAALTACAAVSPEQDTARINTLLADRGASGLGWERNGAVADDPTFKAWLTEPMTVDRAVQAAMLRSPRLQQQYGQLGLARADILDAIQIANPHISASWLPQQGGGGVQTAYGIAFPLVDLLVLPSRVKLAKLEFERARYRIAAAILDVSLDVEAAWYRYVGAQQVADMRAAVADALKISADLSQRYFDAGNITELQLSREKAAASKARIDAARAAAEARLARLDLNTQIGLTGRDVEWKTAIVLPLPVSTEDDPAQLRQIANQNNLSLLAARQEATITAKSAQITRAFRFLGSTALGYDHEQDVDRSIIRGPTLDLELPIFNQGQARVARADAQLQLARARLAQLELSSGNGVDLAAERVRVLSDVVHVYRESLIPERESVTKRSQEEQNFMLIGIFEVIQAKTQEYDAYQGYLEAVRDYWLARVDLMRIVGSRLPSDKEISASTPTVMQILTPPPAAPMGGMAGMDHTGISGAEPEGAGSGAMAAMPGMDHGAHQAMAPMAGMPGMKPPSPKASARHRTRPRVVGRKSAKPKMPAGMVMHGMSQGAYDQTPGDRL